MVKFDRLKLLALLAMLPAKAEMVLVHDQGLYIMSFAQEPGKRTIVYAEGCDPNKDEDFYDNAHALVGGDDFGDVFASAADMKAFVDKAVGSWITFKVTSTQITMSAEQIRPKADLSALPPALKAKFGVS